jgi:hypothetical protein
MQSPGSDQCERVVSIYAIDWFRSARSAILNIAELFGQMQKGNLRIDQTLLFFCGLWVYFVLHLRSLLFWFCS